MGGEPAHIANLKRVTRAEPTRDHLEDLEKELYTQGNDRATAILYGTFVETSLRRLLETKIRDDLSSADRKKIWEYEGPLGSFSPKTIMAYALRLIGPMSRGDLDLIRLLRNEFAHSRVSFNFATPEVADICARLQIVDQPQTSIPLGYLDKSPESEMENARNIAHPRTRYIAACHNLAFRMLLKRGGYPQAGDPVFPNDEPLP
ncbi:MAG TPA: hypothetical protein VGM25_06460 [Caulobacteraceae bacterium]|jgi:hypothetical protein